GASCVLRDAPSRALLSMRYIIDRTNKKYPHPEEAAKRPSRRTHSGTPTHPRVPRCRRRSARRNLAPPRWVSTRTQGVAVAEASALPCAPAAAPGRALDIRDTLPPLGDTTAAETEDQRTEPAIA